MTDNGEVIIAALNDANILFDLDGNYTIEPPAGYTNYPKSAVSADGTMVGWASRGGVSLRSNGWTAWQRSFPSPN